MTITSPQASLAHDGPVRSRELAALRELPSRRPEPPAIAESSIQWIRIDIDRYAISNAGAVVGFIDVVGAVFVAMKGPRYDRATELLQTLIFSRAVEALCSGDRQ